MRPNVSGATHTVQIAGDHRYERLAPLFACHAEEGADCRLTCSRGCSSWEFSDHEHALVDSGECQVVIWLQEGGWTYGGKDGAVLATLPIKVEWTDVGYTWERDGYIWMPLDTALLDASPKRLGGSQ